MFFSYEILQIDVGSVYERAGPTEQEKVRYDKLPEFSRSGRADMRVARAARAMGDSSVASRLIDKAARVDDPELKSSLLKAAIEMGNPDAIPALIDVVNEGGVFGDDAYDIVRGHMEINVGKEQSGKLNEWWKENWNRIQWDAGGHIFRLRK